MTDFVTKLNFNFKTTKFTVEEEIHNQRRFLDSLVIKNNNKSEINVDTKKPMTIDS